MQGRIRSLALLALLGAMPLAAQGKIGLVVGGVSSNLKFDADEGDFESSSKSKTGFAAGVSMAPGSGKIAFAPEALYIMKGAKDDAGDGSTKLSYIEVPLLFRAAIGSSSAKPFVTFGPTVAYLLSCKESDGEESQDCGGDVDENKPKKMDFGIMAGAGATFGKMSVSVRYEMGMANLSKTEGFSVKNTALMALLGIAF